MSRKLGNGYSLALKTSDNTHVTLVYFHNLKRGYEQDMVKSMADDYFLSRGRTHIDMVLGDNHGERSKLVLGDVIDITKDLVELFSTFDIDKTQVSHVDLRGTSESDLNLHVPVANNYLH